MAQYTLIARVSDTLPLAASMDDPRELEPLKAQAKRLLKTLPADAEGQRFTVDAGQFAFHYEVRRGVAFLALAAADYPSQLAFVVGCLLPSSRRAQQSDV